MTEFGFVSVADPNLLETSPQTAGRIIEEVELEVVDDNLEPVPNGEFGALRMRQRHMVKGYLNNPSETNKHFREGWYYPGDIGRLDTDGLLYLSARVDDPLAKNLEVPKSSWRQVAD
jgi:acyl-CoA synthetase (AMP-forming)/AMP-acid ligase II